MGGFSPRAWLVREEVFFLSFILQLLVECLHTVGGERSGRGENNFEGYMGSGLGTRRAAGEALCRTVRQS